MEFQGTDASGTPTNVAYNTTADHCWQMFVSNTATPNIYGNRITNWTNWTHPVAYFHTDGIMVFGSPATPYIYNNYIYGNLDPSRTGAPTSMVYCTYGESLGDTSSCKIFNNTFNGGNPISFHGGETGPQTLYNNTFISPESAVPIIWSTQSPFSQITFTNNIIDGNGAKYAYLYEDGYVSDITAADYNDWYNLRTLENGPFPSNQTLAQWQTASGFDTHSITGDPNLAASYPYTLRPGSPAIGTAVNLTSLCTGRLAPLCTDAAGNPRSSSGNWDPGAYVYKFDATTTTLSSSLNPSITGHRVTFTATITPSAATGTVRFYDGATLKATKTVSSGTATYGTAALPYGSNSITAVYSGDSIYSGSTSAPIDQDVLEATACAISSPSSSPNPSAYGQEVTFTGTVTSSLGAPPDGETVSFQEGSTVLGTGTLTGGSASFTTSTLKVGTTTVKAVYGGNSNFGGSTSKVVKQVVKKASN